MSASGCSLEPNNGNRFDRIEVKDSILLLNSLDEFLLQQCDSGLTVNLCLLWTCDDLPTHVRVSLCLRPNNSRDGLWLTANELLPFVMSSRAFTSHSLVTLACFSSARGPQLSVPIQRGHGAKRNKKNKQATQSHQVYDLKTTVRKWRHDETFERFHHFQQEDLKQRRMNNSVWARQSVFCR